MLSDRIRLLREERGMRQEDLAVQLHVSASAIGMYEQGRRMPALDTLVDMAQIFSVTVDYLATGNGSPHFAAVGHPDRPEECPCGSCFWKEYAKAMP